MEANYIVVRFGELTTKGKNRKLFTQKLLKNTKEIRIDVKLINISISSAFHFFIGIIFPSFRSNVKNSLHYYTITKYSRIQDK